MSAPKGRFLPLGKSRESEITEGQVPDAPETCLTGTCPYTNERVLQTKDSHKRKTTHHSLARAALNDDGGAFEGEEFLLEEQCEAVRDFNTLLVPLGFKPVTKLSAGVEKVLEKFDAESVRRLITETFVESDDVFIPKNKTFVRLCWDNLQ